MAGLEIGGLQRTSSINKDAAKSAALLFGSRVHL